MHTKEHGSHPACRIRRAASADLPQIQKVVTAAYHKYLTRMKRPPAPLLSDYAALVDAGGLWVLGDPVIGLISLSCAGGSLVIENVAVHPAAQGAGLGRRLMEFAEQQAARRHLRRLTLYTNEAMTENIAIYLHLGYAETERRTEEGYRRVFMEKFL